MLLSLRYSFLSFIGNIKSMFLLQKAVVCNLWCFMMVFKWTVGWLVMAWSLAVTAHVVLDGVVEMGVSLVVAFWTRWNVLLIIRFEFAMELFLERRLLFEVVVLALSELGVDDWDDVRIWRCGLVSFAGGLKYWWTRVACKALKEFALIKLNLVRWTSLVWWFRILVTCLGNETLAAFEIHRVVHWWFIWATSWIPMVRTDLILKPWIFNNWIKLSCTSLVIHPFIPRIVKVFQLFLHHSRNSFFIFVNFILDVLVRVNVLWRLVAWSPRRFILRETSRYWLCLLSWIAVWLFWLVVSYQLACAASVDFILVGDWID